MSSRSKRMSVSEDTAALPRQRTLSGGPNTPKTSSKRTRTTSQSHNKPLHSPKGDKAIIGLPKTDSPKLERRNAGSPKAERRRSASFSEGKHKKQVEVPPKQYHSYRMHRVRFFDYEPQPVNCIACDEPNNRIALSRSDGSIEVWTLGTQTLDLYQQYIIRNESGTSIEALLWHDGSLYRAGLDGDLVQYDMATLKPKSYVPCHAGAVWCLALDKSKTYIAAGTEEGCVVIFEHTGDGFRYMKSLQKQEERMICVDWHTNGDVIVTGGIDNIRLWSVESGNALQRITIARQSPQKPTIVWAVHILKDMTIVSGDSRGKLTFWNGKHGTQIKMFSCHRADILSIAVSEDETQVYAAGIDPVLVQFELTPVSISSDWMVWQRCAVRAHHTCDVRAVVMMNGVVISGGVDCSLVAANFESKLKYKSIPLPHHRLVHLARDAGLLLLQYTSHIQLWTLGITNTQLANRDQSQNVLPLSASPVNLLELRTRNEEHIVCTAISDSAEWIAYGDRDSLRVFNLVMSQSEMLAPRISASRLKGLPASLSQVPIRCMQFAGNGKLFLGYINGSIKYMELKVTNCVPQIRNVVSSLPVKAADAPAGILVHMRVSTDGSRVATSDSLGSTLVYADSGSELKLMRKLPREDIPITSLVFSPDCDSLAYSLSSRKIVEFDLVKNRYAGAPTATLPPTQKSKQHHHLNVVSKVLNLQYASHDSNLILAQDALGVRLYNRETGTLSSTRNMYDYRYLMHFEELQEDFAVVVERTPLSLSTALPQALSRKQFGT